MPKDLPDQKQQIAESAPSPEEAPQAISPVRSTASSPEWPLATKIIVGLVLVAISGFLIIRFNQYLNLLLMAFLLSFLVHPIARFVSKRLGIKWGASVLIVYLALAADRAGRAAAWHRWLNAPLDPEEVARIRAYMAQERALGEPRFQAMVEKALGQPASLRPRGRPPLRRPNGSAAGS